MKSTLFLSLTLLALLAIQPRTYASSLISHDDIMAIEDQTDVQSDEVKTSPETLSVEEVVASTETGKTAMNSDHKKSIFAILKSYHQYKIHNRALVKNFKHNYRALKAELRDSNSELSQAMVLAKKTCDSTPESCRQAFNQLVRARFEAKMNPQSISWINYFLPSAQAESSGFLFQTCTSGSLNDNGQQNDLNFHALFFGALDYTCESRDFKMKIYGPGLSYEGLGMFGMACSSDQGGNNVGLIAGASLGIGVKTALTIGDSGICTLVGLSAGVGAYAGVAVMKMK